MGFGISHHIIDEIVFELFSVSDPAATTGTEMRDSAQRFSGPTAKSPANPSKSRKTAADMATVFLL